MDSLEGETLQALGEVSPEVLRALAGVPVEVLQALRDVPPDTLRGLQPGAEEAPVEQPVRSPSEDTSPAVEELKLALQQVIEAMEKADVNVVGCLGKYRNARTQKAWCNVRWDSGGGGVSRLLELPDYEVAQVFASLGSEVRLAILRRLLEVPRSAAELVADLHLGTTGQAYHHLQELIRTGFVEARDGQYHFNDGRRRDYFTALLIAADLAPAAPGPSTAAAQA